MYADDIALYQEISTQSDYARIQKDVDSLCVWIANNRLKLKCCYITFSHMCPHCQISLFILRVIDSRVDQFKYLGVIFTKDLKWTKHMNSICNKTRRLIGMFYRKFYMYSCRETSLKLDLQIFISPSCIWNMRQLLGSAPNKRQLMDVQKFALKVCTCTKNWGTIACSYNPPIELQYDG